MSNDPDLTDMLAYRATEERAMSEATSVISGGNMNIEIGYYIDTAITTAQLTDEDTVIMDGLMPLLSVTSHEADGKDAANMNYMTWRNDCEARAAA